jgi:hypothetical protein
MIEIMSALFSKTAIRSAIGRLDIPHWTMMSHLARTARIVSAH